MSIQKCIVCSTDDASSNDRNDFYNCKRCGRFTINCGIGGLNSMEKSILSHWIRKQQKFYHSEQNPMSDENGHAMNLDISSIIQNKKNHKEVFDIKISLQEKMDSIIFKIGSLSNYFGDKIKATPNFQKELAAFSGCIINFEKGSLESEYTKLIWSLERLGSLVVDNSSGYSLTETGFLKYEQLQSQINKSKKVFMAMKFDKNQSTTSYQAKSHLGEILKEFKLELFSMENNETLGNIIEVMKAEINDAKFIICDLSDGNRGAYWEAGYAEGQKKKVIYICDEKIFSDEELNSQDKERKIHFDIKQTRIIKFDFSSEEKIQIFKKEIESSIKANGLNI